MKNKPVVKEFEGFSENVLEIFTLLSHEIRTPLNAIVGVSDLLQNKESHLYKEEYYRILKSTSESLLELVNNILDYGKLNSGVLEVSERTFCLKQKLIDSLHSQKLAAGSKGLEFTLEFDPSVPDFVIGDQVKVAQIFINLVSNSIKFTQKGKVEIGVSKKEMARDSVVIECKVKDTGIGIPSEHLDRIFDAFHQGEEDININYAGTGLGLNITRRLIKMLKGSLEVESEKGIGTTFTFLLPFKFVEGEGAKEDRVSGFDISRLRGKNVLLVEDNKINRLVISRYLKLWKMNYEVAQNGREALSKIKDFDFDIILMDIHMPKMNGIETLERIRSSSEERHRKLPVIALTATAMEGEAKSLLYSRFDGFITKPFEADKLRELLTAYANLK